MSIVSRVLEKLCLGCMYWKIKANVAEEWNTTIVYGQY